MTESLQQQNVIQPTLQNELTATKNKDEILLNKTKRISVSV